MKQTEKISYPPYLGSLILSTEETRKIENKVNGKHCENYNALILREKANICKTYCTYSTYSCLEYYMLQYVVLQAMTLVYFRLYQQLAVLLFV